MIFHSKLLYLNSFSEHLLDILNWDTDVCSHSFIYLHKKYLLNIYNQVFVCA